MTLCLKLNFLYKYIFLIKLLYIIIKDLYIYKKLKKKVNEAI